MSAQKGNLEAVLLCRDTKEKLYVCGGDGDAEYKRQIQSLCDGENIKFLGEITDNEKIHLMQTCKALLYYLPRPEVTSHKIQETTLCGAPVLTSDIGAMPEIVRHGIDGILCRSDQDYIKGIKEVGKLKPDVARFKEIYNPVKVVDDYIPLYTRVANGERWR